MTSERFTVNESRDILRITNMLAAHATQKELVVMAVGIILYLKYTTETLEGFFFFFPFGFYRQNKHLTLQGRDNLIAQKVSQPAKMLGNVKTA